MQRQPSSRNNVCPRLLVGRVRDAGQPAERQREARARVQHLWALVFHRFNPRLRFYGVVSAPGCGLPYNCRKRLRLLFKLLKLCAIWGRREQETAHWNGQVDAILQGDVWQTPDTVTAAKDNAYLCTQPRCAPTGCRVVAWLV